MKVVTLFLLSILCLQTECYLIKVPTSITTTRVATGGWVHVQKLLLPLFDNVCEESAEPVIVRLSEDFKSDSSGFYMNSEAFTNFQNLKATKGLLAKGEIFTEYNPDHLKELKVIYDLLYYARDFDTFYKAACWARQNVNCGLFVDAIYLAILNRRDTEKVSLPAPYEVLPNYFIKQDYILKASSLIRGEAVSLSDTVRNEGNTYFLDVNYTTSFYDDTDDKLAYFHEDIGLNSYYFLTKLNNLRWLNDSQRKSYGLDMYHLLKQMVTRYNLERYSNGLPEIDGIRWNDVKISNYDPMLIYSNGHEFCPRISAITGNGETLTALSNIEGNVQAVVMHMRDGGYSKSDILNQLMEIFITNDRSYIKLALQFINEDGFVSRYPSVLEHYMTSVRDPLYWKLIKKIVDLVDDALKVLPSYSTNELYFPGVEIKNIEVKKMMTTFDTFKFDVTSALKTKEEEVKFEVKIAQPRLNHKPFSFKIYVSSLVTQKAFVKIFLGPKVMPGELVENKNLFMLLDSFDVNLKIGSNVVTRSSNEMKNLSPDFLSLESLDKMVLDAEFGVDALPLKSVWSQIGFPSRLIIPRGTSEGLPLHVFVFIAPYVKATVGGSRTNMNLNTEAINSPGYPLDLNIELQQLFNLPNAMIKDIFITHKTESTAYNRPPNNYSSNNRVFTTEDHESEDASSPVYLSARPEFTKRTFDYKSKNNQYGKQTDYTAKRDNYNYQNKESRQVNTQGETDRTNVNTNPEKEESVYSIYKNSDRDYDVDNAILKNTPIAYKTESSFYDETADSDISNSIPVVEFPTEDQDTDVPRGRLYLSSRPEFTKKSFDYKSKKNQYKKKTDYATKRGNSDYQNNKSELGNVEKEGKTNGYTELENVGAVNNIYTKSIIDYDDINEKKYSKNSLDKVKENFDKFIDIKTHEIKGYPESMDIVNNIYMSPDVDIPIANDDKTGYHVFIYDKDHTQTDKRGNSDVEKVIEIKNSNVKPHGLLTMPRRKNIFNVFLKPLKIFDSNDLLYK